MRTAVLLACLISSLAQAQRFCPATITSALDSADETIPRRVNRNATPSACGTAKTFPGTTGMTSPYAFEKHRFANRTGASACVTFTLTTQSVDQDFHLVGYTTFVKEFPDTNYLGDSGSSSLGSTVSMSLTLAANAQVDAVVYTVTPASYGSYTLTAAGCGGLAPTSVTLSSSVTPSTAGQNVTFTALVLATDAGQPTGPVTFYDDTTALGSGALDSTGRATLSTTTLSVGSHPMTAQYAGDGEHVASSTAASLSQVVNKATTSTAVTVTPSPAPLGADVTITATVSLVAPGALPVSGDVTFFDGSTTLGTGSVGAGGIATFSTSSLAARTHTFTAHYPGDENALASTSPVVSLVVKKIDTAVTLSSSVNPSAIGAAVTFTAVVSGTGSPTGYMTFQSGGSTLGSVDLGGGTSAEYSTSSLAVGSSSITAEYSGDAMNASSVSPPLNQLVTSAAAVLVLTATPKNLSYGAPMTLSVTLSGANGVPTGSVTFKDGQTILGTETVSGTGGATVSGAMLAAGLHTIAAEYSGDVTYEPSIATTSLSISKASTNTTLTSSANPSALGAPVTFTVRVTSSGGANFTGQVDLTDVSASLGTSALSNGVATFTTSTLSAGPHELSSRYAGDKNFEASSSMVVAQRVTGGDGGVVARPDAGTTAVKRDGGVDGGIDGGGGAPGCSCNGSGIEGVLAAQLLVVARRRRHARRW